MQGGRISSTYSIRTEEGPFFLEDFIAQVITRTRWLKQEKEAGFVEDFLWI